MLLARSLPASAELSGSRIPPTKEPKDTESVEKHPFMKTFGHPCGMPLGMAYGTVSFGHVDSTQHK